MPAHAGDGGAVVQVNVVLPRVAEAVAALRAIGADVPDPPAGWEGWATHHLTLPVVPGGAEVELDSTSFARHWGGLPEGFAGAVVNLALPGRVEVDARFERAVALGAEVLRPPHDAFWGARYAVVAVAGPLVVGLMSPPDAAYRSTPPPLDELA